MSGRLMFALLLVWTVLVAEGAFALAECAEGQSELVDDHAEAPNQQGRVILPCAIADLAQLAGGSACAEADFYVVSTSGVLLCQIDLPVWAPSTLPHVERAPAAHAASSSAFAVAGLSSQAAAAAPALVRELPDAPFHVDGSIRDGFSQRPSAPS